MSDDSDSAPILDATSRLRAELEQLKQNGADEIEKAKQHADALEKQLRDPLIAFLVINGKGSFNENDLTELSLEDLKVVKRTFIGDVAENYEAFLSERERKRQAAIPLQGTVGAYNQETKEFEKGV